VSSDIDVQCVMGAARSVRLAQLAEQIRQVRHHSRAASGRCPSGVSELDAALGGGFCRAAIHEFIPAAEGTGVFSLVWRVAARAAGTERWIVAIDTQADLYPPGLLQTGVSLGRLIVVRTSQPSDALWACEQVLRCSAVAAVVLPLRGVDSRASRRLQLAAETGGGLGLLIRGDKPTGPTFAASRLYCEPLVGPPGMRRLRITVQKLREGRPCGPLVVEWSDAPGVVSASAVLGDGTGVA
jgi:protein ImuA